ncbi:MAG TPA: DUF3106 domain-containing protein [Rhodocyclaceae bacterium]|nr:DUF3106 domain-containing protein [Rhodocyclaceae bacterium]
MARAFLAIAATVALLLALAAPASAGVPSLKQPEWMELSPQQREILAPLSVEWDQFAFYRRKKWLGVARRYPSLSPHEQQRLQRRMQAWVKLTPEQRERAREQYKNLKKAPPGQRLAIKQKWQEYEELPEAEKERLKQASRRRPQTRTATVKRPAPVVVAPVTPVEAPPALAVPVVPAPAAPAGGPQVRPSP